MIERAWSSEDGFVIAYLVKNYGERSLIFNEDGEVSEIHGQGIDLDKKWLALEERHLKTRPLHEVSLIDDRHVVLITTVQNGKERIIRCTCQGTMINRGGNVHGIEQLMVATHFDVFSAGKHVETLPLPEHLPLLLRNGRELIGLVQGSLLKAEVKPLGRAVG
jgi:hypothetical protein